MAARTRTRSRTHQKGRSRARRTAGSSGRSKTSASRKPDAIRMLKDDHRRVEALFDRFESARGEEQKGRLASTICEELKLHAKLEEEIVYPAVREAIGDEDLMNEAEVEHASAKDLIRQIEASSPSDERFDALVTVLGEYVKHHVKEEEREMFKKVRGTDLDLAALGEQMQERKRETANGGSRKGFIAALLPS